GGWTLRITSLAPNTSAAVATTLAPAAPYAASGNAAASPAPCSTSTVKPAFASRPAASGTSATRRSCGAVSFGTPIFIPPPGSSATAEQRQRQGERTYARHPEEARKPT